MDASFFLALFEKAVGVYSKFVDSHPSKDCREGEKHFAEPEKAAQFYLRCLKRHGPDRSPNLAAPIKYLFDRCRDKRRIPVTALVPLAGAEVAGNWLILSAPADSPWSGAYLPEVIGKGLYWGMRYTAVLEKGIEYKTSIADLSFAIVTPDHSTGCSRSFRYDDERKQITEIKQESPVLVRRNHPLRTTLLLIDDLVWYLVDDAIVFAIRLSAYDQEKWRESRPILSTWNSERVRISDITVYDLATGWE